MGMHESGSMISDIASRLNRHRNCISRFLKNPTEYGTVKRSGPKTQDRLSCYKRGFGGVTVMVWAPITYKGKTRICFISTRMNVRMYVELLDSELIESAGNLYGDY